MSKSETSSAYHKAFIVVAPPTPSLRALLGISVQPAISNGLQRRLLSWGYPNSWMAYFMENPKIKLMRMRTGGTPILTILGHLHVYVCVRYTNEKMLVKIF
jgi:hypothetical protein